MSEVIQRFRLVVVDDLPDRFVNVAEASRMLAMRQPTCIAVDSDDTYVEAEINLSALPSDSTVLLDLSLHKGDKLWSAVARNLASLAELDLGVNFTGVAINVRTDFGPLVVGQILLDGISLIAPILHGSKGRRVLVVVASGVGHLTGVSELLKRLNQYASQNAFSVRFEMEPGTRDLSAVANAVAILSDLEAIWLKHFPDPSRDPIIAAVLADYLEPCKVPGLTQVVWTHDWCASAEGVEYGNRVTQNGITDFEDNKALHMRSSERVAFRSEPLSNDLNIVALRKMLARLEISALVPDDVVDFKLPVMPGVACLLALRVLLLELRKDASGTDVVFWQQGNVFGITVPLQSKRLDGRAGASQFEHLRGFLNKVSVSPENGGPLDGLSRAIWSLCHGRVDGLEYRKPDPWMEMFENGPGRWVAWPSFVEDGIVFAW